MKTPERVIVDQLALDVLQSANFSSKQNAVAAQILGARPADVWRANEDGYVSPALLRAMAAAGYLDPHEVAAVLTVEVPPCAECGGVHTTKTCTNRKSPDRGRTFAARLPDDLFDEITAEARRWGQTNGELLSEIWDHYLLTTQYKYTIMGQRAAEAATEER